jgi:DNA-binding beta-propeller fold protein YncE
MVHTVVSGHPIRSAFAALTVTIAVIAASTILTRGQSSQNAPSAVPGVQPDGTTLLANGWRIAPAGRHLRVGTLPLNAVISPDGRYAVVNNDGLNRPSLSIIDIPSWTVKSTMPLDAAWLGVVFHPDGTRLFASAGGQNSVREFAFADGVLTAARTFPLPPGEGDTFAGGLSITRDGRTLFVTRVFAMTLSAIDVAGGTVRKTINLPSEPYTSVVSADGRMVYVSLWGGAEIQAYLADSLTLVARWFAGEHPNAMALSNDGLRLFVACASSASVWVFDTFSGDPIEQISTSLFPDSPPTSTPNSVGLSPDGRRCSWPTPTPTRSR